MGDEPLPFGLKVGLRAGSVYYFHTRELSSAESHLVADELKSQL